MKKIYLFGALLITALTSNAQVILSEDFNYTVPGNIGGSTTTTTDGIGSNNWLTQSNTSGIAGTIDVLSGSLNYTGLQASTGNRVFIAGNNATVPRDVNRAITTSSTTIYTSFLLNVADNTQLTSTISGNNNYFFGIGQTAGTAVTIIGARLGITSSNSAANYRLHISNNTGGTPTYTENAVDLNFAQTYLVVVKLDRSVSPIAATLWVNPINLGGSEPAGSVSNNSGTGTFTAFASVVIRNASATPKADIDEIRVGNTWADVTPASLSVDQNNIAGLKVYPNPAKQFLNITSASFAEKKVELYDVLGKIALTAKVTNQPVNVASLPKGVYVAKITEEGKTATRKIVIE